MKRNKMPSSKVVPALVESGMAHMLFQLNKLYDSKKRKEYAKKYPESYKRIIRTLEREERAKKEVELEELKEFERGIANKVIKAIYPKQKLTEKIRKQRKKIAIILKKYIEKHYWEEQ